MEENWGPHHVFTQEKTMDQSHRRNNPNDVNGRSADADAASSGRDGYAPQVTPVRHQATVSTKQLIRVATWNVNTLYQLGKYDNLKQEMARMRLDVVGVSEVRWTGVGQCGGGGVEFVYSGGEEHQRGVGVMMTTKTARCMMGYMAISDRVLLVKLAGKPININIIQVYAPTADRPEEELDEFYEMMEQAMRQCKPHEINLVMGDLNAKIGQGREGEVVGQFGLGVRNERGERLVEWCAEKGQVIVNSFFRHHPRRLWTWKSPGGQYKNQIDYVTINKRFRNAVTQCKTYPGADCGRGCDHTPVVAEIRVKLKNGRTPHRREIRNWNLLKREDIKTAFEIEVRNRYDALQDEGEHEIEGKWKNLQQSLLGAVEELVPCERRRAKQKWMTEDILNLMEERRLLKGNPDRYREMDREVKRRCKERKEEWLKEQCDEVEQLERVNSKQMYEKVRELSGNRRPTKSSAVKDEQGNVLMDLEEVLGRWEQYIGELYNDARGNRQNFEGELTGPTILREEIEHAIKSMRKGKAVGEDEISVEMIDAAGIFGLEKVTAIANMIYNTGYIPEMMRESTFIAIPKKKGTLECEKNRTISIMSQLGKIILCVIRNRNRQKIDNYVSEEQYGFRKGKGTVNAIFNLRMITERTVEMQKDIYMCFVDFEKAFDMVRHEDLIRMLQGIGLDDKDIRLISNLYWDQKAAVKIDNVKTEWVEIRRGVRQGCVLSPDLFSLYGQKCMEELEDMDGIKIGGRNINNVRYADDTVLLAESEEKLQNLIDALTESCGRKGLKININKTEVMGITKRNERLRVRIIVQGRLIKQVENFKYLGSIISENANCDKEIKTRIGIAKTAFGKMKKILTNINMNIDLRLRLLRCYVWSTLLYGCEAWTVKKSMEKRLEAAEMWFLRRMLRIPWTARVTNEEVMRRAGVERRLLKTIRKKQLNFIGHIMRADGLERNCLLGRVEGTRSRGRQRIKYMDALLEQLGDGRRVVDLVRLADDRTDWRSMVADVT